MTIAPLKGSHPLSDNNSPRNSATPSGKEEAKKQPKNRQELIGKAQEYGLIDNQWSPKSALCKVEMPPLNDEEGAEILEKLFEPFDIFIFNDWIRISWGELLTKFLEKISKDGGVTINEKTWTDEGKIQWVGKKVPLKITKTQLIGSYVAHILFKTGYAGRRLEKMGDGDLYQKDLTPKHLLDSCEDIDLRLHMECEYEDSYLLLKEVRNVFVDVLSEYFVTVHRFAKPQISILSEAFKAVTLIYPGKNPDKKGAEINCFLNLSIKGSPIDCTVEKDLARHCVFSREDTYISIENLYSENRESKIQFIPQSHTNKGALGLLHLYLGILQAESVSTIDDKGLFRLHTLMAKGEISNNKNLESRLLGQTIHVLNQSPNDIPKWVGQHFSRNPFYTLSFFFRAFQFMEKQAPHLFQYYRKSFKETDFSFSETDAGEFLHIIHDLLFENSHNHTLIADVVNLAILVATPSKFLEIEDLSEETLLLKAAPSDVMSESSCAFLVEIDPVKALQNLAEYERKHRDSWEKIESPLSALFFLLCSKSKTNSTHPKSKLLIKEAKALLVDKSGPFSKFIALSLLLTLSSSEKERADLFFTHLPAVFQTLRNAKEAQFLLSFGEELLKEPNALASFANQAGTMEEMLQREAHLEYSKKWCTFLLSKKKAPNHPIDLQDIGIKIFKQIIEGEFEEGKFNFALELIENLCSTDPEKALSLFIALKSKKWFETQSQKSLKSIIECVRILSRSDASVKKELFKQFGGTAITLLKEESSEFNNSIAQGLARLALDLTDSQNKLALVLLQTACEKNFICEGRAYYKCWIVVLMESLKLSAHETFELWKTYLKDKEHSDSLELLLALAQKLLSEGKTEELSICLVELASFDIPEERQALVEALFSSYAKIKNAVDGTWPISSKCKEKLNLDLLQSELDKGNFSQAVVRFRSLCKEQDFPDSYQQSFDKLFEALLKNCKYDLALKLVNIALDARKHPLEKSILYLKQILEKNSEDSELLLFLLGKESSAPEATRIQIAHLIIGIVEKEAIFETSYLFKHKTQLAEAFARYFPMLEQSEPDLFLRCVNQCYIKGFSLQKTSSNAHAWFSAMKASSYCLPLLTSAMKFGFFHVAGIRKEQTEILGLIIENETDAQQCENCLQILFAYEVEEEFKEAWVAAVQKGIIKIRESQPLNALLHLDFLTAYCLEWCNEQARFLLTRFVEKKSFEDLATWLNSTKQKKESLREYAYHVVTAWLTEIEAIPEEYAGSGKAAVARLVELLKKYAQQDEPGNFLWQKLIFLACIHAPERSWELFQYVRQQNIFEKNPEVMQGVLLATLTGLRSINSDIIKKFLKEGSEFDQIFQGTTESEEVLRCNAYYTLIMGLLELLKKEKDKEEFFKKIETRFERFKSLSRSTEKKITDQNKPYIISIFSVSKDELREHHLEIAMMIELLKGYTPKLRAEGKKRLESLVDNKRTVLYAHSLVPLINLLFKKYDPSLESHCYALVKSIINTYVQDLDYLTIINQLISTNTAYSIYLGAMVLQKAYENDFQKDPNAWKCLVCTLEALDNLDDDDATDNYKNVFAILEKKYAEQLHLPEYQIEYLYGRLLLNLSKKDKTDKQESEELISEILTALPHLLEQEKIQPFLIAIMGLLLKLSYFSESVVRSKTPEVIKIITSTKSRKALPELFVFPLRLNIIRGLRNLKTDHPHKKGLFEFSKTLLKQLYEDFPKKQKEINEAIPSYETETPQIMLQSQLLHFAANLTSMRESVLKNLHDKEQTSALLKSLNHIFEVEQMFAQLDSGELITLYYGLVQESNMEEAEYFYQLSTLMFKKITSEMRRTDERLFNGITFLRILLFVKLCELSKIENVKELENKNCRVFALCNLQAMSYNIQQDFFGRETEFPILLQCLDILAVQANFISSFFTNNPNEKDETFLPMAILLSSVFKKYGASDFINKNPHNQRLLKRIGDKQEKLGQGSIIKPDCNDFSDHSFSLNLLKQMLEDRKKEYASKYAQLEKTYI